MLKSIIYFLCSLIVFLAGILLYGIILNLREQTLSEVIQEKQLTYLANIHILIDRRNYKLHLYSGDVLLKSYKVVFGRNNNSRKYLRDKYATPAGTYSICRIDTVSPYRKFLMLNYPNRHDLEGSLKAGEITREAYFRANEELQFEGCSHLPGFRDADIGIQGIGRLDFILKNLPFVYNWTNGSAAVSNDNIDEIYKVIKVGTEVVIKN